MIFRGPSSKMTYYDQFRVSEPLAYLQSSTALTTDTQTSAISCSTTITTAATTQIPYARFTPRANTKREAAEVNELEARQQAPGYGARSYPDFMQAGCRHTPSLAKVQAACRCFLTPPVVTGPLYRFRWKRTLLTRSSYPPTGHGDHYCLAADSDCYPERDQYSLTADPNSDRERD